MSLKQLEALYKLICLRNTSIMNELPQEEIKNIVETYKQVTNRGKLPMKSPEIRPRQSAFGKLVGIRTRKRQLSGKLIHSRMGDIQEESEDCGTPTPGKFQIEKSYTFGDNINKANIPTIEKSNAPRKLSQSEDVKIKNKEESKETSLNESDFDKDSEDEDDSLDIQSCTPEELESKRKKIEEQLKMYIKTH